MGKKKNQYRQRQRWDELDNLEDDEPMALRFREETDEDDEPRFSFDVDRWQRDLFERSSHRARMRDRDIKKGILRIPPPPDAYAAPDPMIEDEL